MYLWMLTVYRDATPMLRGNPYAFPDRVPGAARTINGRSLAYRHLACSSIFLLRTCSFSGACQSARASRHHHRSISFVSKFGVP